LVITDQELDAIELAKARTYFPYVLRTETKFFNPGRLEEFAGVDTEKMSDLELISQFFEKVAGKKLNAVELKTVTAAFEDANKSLEAGK
jgi:hypothetical protein